MKMREILLPPTEDGKVLEMQHAFIRLLLLILAYWILSSMVGSGFPL